MAEELSKVLTRLLRDILNTVKNAKDSGKIRKVERLWVHQKIMNFEYNKGLTGFSSLQERVIKKEWDERDKFQVIKKIMELPSYEEACRRVSEVYDIEESRAKYFVERFINYIVNNALNENVGEETLSETITTFINDLEGNPVIWEVVVEIDGLWLKDEEIELDRGVKIRRPKPEDFEFEQPFEVFLGSFSSPFTYPSAIIEITQKASQSYIWDELEKLITALRLYRIGSIVKRKTILRPKSILRFGEATVSSLSRPSIVYKYGLASEESHKIRAFLNKIKPLLPISEGRIQGNDYISIALQRYNEALLKPNPAERLAYAVMGLEALFLKEHEELRHRLAQRVAKFLSILGYQRYRPLEVYKTMKKSYDIRSNFVHGALVKKERQREASELANKVMEYLRVSLLAFLELKGKERKDDLLNIIDNSLLDQEEQAKLRDLIEKNCEVALMLIK